MVLWVILLDRALSNFLVDTRRDRGKKKNELEDCGLARTDSRVARVVRGARERAVAQRGGGGA